MKQLLLIVAATLYATLAAAQTPCSGGTAGGYDCNGMTLQSRLTIAQMGGQGYGSNDPAEAQDSWGWTDSTTNKEYAIVAMNDRTSFVDITNPNAPIFLGTVLSQTSTSWWRDVKVYNNHAYIVSDDNGNHGMQIFDLTRLRNVPSPPTTFAVDGQVSWGSGNPSNKGIAHNIVINEDTGYAYVVGTGGYANGGVVIYNLNASLTNPPEVATISAYGYCHDAQVVTYNGPDTEHVGKELLIGSFSTSDFVRILDVSNGATSVSQIGVIDYPDKAYTHQGWFTEDQRFFILGDELDETGSGFNTRTLVFDMIDLDSPQLVYEHSGATPAIDHNGYIRGNRFYLANYRAGMRVFKFEDLYDPSATGDLLDEVEFFDTHPGSNSAAYNGAWNVYPFFPSGNIIVSDLDRGLFVLKDPNFDETPPTAVCQNFTATLDKNTGTVTIDAADINNGSSDNIGIIEMTISGQTTFTCADVGSTFNVTLTVKDDYGYTDSCTTTVTVAGEDTVYQGGGTWSNGLPGIGSNAKISSADYNTADAGNSSFSACSCEIEAGNTLTVGADTFIEIENDIIVDGSLIVEHTGNVVQTIEDAAVIKGASGVINVKLTTPVLQTRDFMVMGSPMDAETRNDVFTDAFLVLKHNTSNFVPDATVPSVHGVNFADASGTFWQSYSGAIDVGEGYIVRPQEGYSDPANEAYNMTYTQGTLNNGDYTRSITLNGASDNTPNIYSNPYPSAMSGFDLINQNPSITEIYFWEHLTPPSSSIPGWNISNFSMRDISMYNMGGGTKAPNDTSPTGTTEPNGIISTGQGFAVMASAAGSITMNNSMRLTSGNTTLRTPNEAELDKIWLQVSSVDYDVSSSTLVGFNPEATEGIDRGYDSRRLYDIISIFSTLPNSQTELGIQTTSAFDDSKKFPIGFSTEIEGSNEYVISIDKVLGSRIENARVFLYDVEEDITTELTTTNYTFKSNAKQSPQRFTLFFISDNVLGPNDEDREDIVVFPNPAKDLITIFSAQEPLHRVEIYDLRGRLIQEDIDEEITSTSVDISKLQTGVYFVKVFIGSGTITKKLIKE